VSSTKFLQISTIFVTAFLVGIAWVGLFYLLQYGTREAVFLTARPESVEKNNLLPMTDEFFTPPQVDEDNPDAFDPEGIYTVTKITKPGFRDFDSIVINNKELNVDCDHADFGRLVKPNGLIFFRKPFSSLDGGSGTDIHDILISDGTIKFRTEPENGIRYEFVGEFLVKGNFYALDPDFTVLEGTLTKLVNDKQVAETRASFTWSIDLTCVC